MYGEGGNDTVNGGPGKENVDGGPGEEMFSSMMDQTISSEAASGWERGVGAALYRQLRPLLSGADAAPAADAAAEGSL